MSTNNTNNELRIPPQSIDAEKALLGCVLIDTLALSKAYEIINIKSFYNNNHAIIFENMVEMEKNSQEIDNITITNQLKKNKVLESVGGQNYIADLSINAPSSANVEYYANIIKEKSVVQTEDSVILSQEHTHNVGIEHDHHMDVLKDTDHKHGLSEKNIDTDYYLED